jgi:hypothetical protein
MRIPRYSRRIGFPLLVATMCLRTLGDVSTHPVPPPMAFPGAMPQTVLWAWEEPEDLRTADSRKVGVAYLARTLLLGDASRITTLFRRQPLEVPAAMAVMAVVRITTQPGFRDTPALRQETANTLAEVSYQRGLHALQIDFDATYSERAFYTGVLRELRPQMPPGMPLSITALASWCASAPGPNPQQDWLAGLPIDEAVPMFFRLGGHAQPYGDKSWIPVREPLCGGSIGLSTDESWPQVPAASRIYLFAPRPWLPEQLIAAASPLEGARPAALRVRNRGVGDLRSASRIADLRTGGDAFEKSIPTEGEQ